MKFKGFFVGILLGLFIGGCCVPKNISVPLSQTQQEQQYRKVAMLQVKSVDGKSTAVATGFAIDKQTIVTAGHFCANVKKGYEAGELRNKVRVVTVNDNGELHIVTRGHIVMFDEKVDLCLVKAKKHGLIPMTLANSRDIKIRQRVKIIGAPLGVFPVETDGYIVSAKYGPYLGDGYDGRLVVSAPATFGNSGGPILSEDGKIIGVVMAKADYDHIILGVHINQLKRFLKKYYE